MHLLCFHSSEPILPWAVKQYKLMFWYFSVLVLSLSIKAKGETIALAICRVMSGLEEGIECIVGDGAMLFFLCCGPNCLSVLQQLMEINKIKTKLSDAVHVSIRFGNIKLLEWVWSFKPDVFHCSYKSCVLLAGSCGRLYVVQWLCTIMGQLPASSGIDSKMLFWSTVLERFYSWWSWRDEPSCIRTDLSL